MTHKNRLILIGATAMAITSIIGCGGSKKDASKDQSPSAEAPTAPTAPTGAASAPQNAGAKEASSAPVVRDDTADAAIETYLTGIKTGNLDLSISVLVPDTPGADQLVQMKAGWDKAAAEGAPIEMAKAVMAGEIDALKYEKISDDGAFATFRFTKPTSDTPWEIQAIKTPEGWRIKPPDSGLPQS